MSRRLQFAAAVFCALFVVLSLAAWLRSLWTVDKLRVQVLPNQAMNLRLLPGEVTLWRAHSTSTLPVGECHWFSWPVNYYFGDYSPMPEDPIFGEFARVHGGVTVPLWFLAVAAVVVGSMPLGVAAAVGRLKKPALRTADSAARLAT